MCENVVERKQHGTRCRWLALTLLALVAPGCRFEVSEVDRIAAKAVVERAIASESYDDFLGRFTARNRERMKGSQVWIKWWQQKIGRDRALWKVVDVRGTGNGSVEVIAQHQKLKTIYQYFRLSKEGYAWLISEIEIERQ